jgi:uncharacterized protein with von Willebrand factor type A (vWA) domain
MRKPTKETLDNFEHYWDYGGSKLTGTTKEVARNAYINGRAHAFDEGYKKRYWYERELENKAKAAIEEKHRIEQQERIKKMENSNNYSC